MPLIQISIAEGRRPEQVRELIRSVTSAVSTSLDAPVDSIRVLVTEVALTHWGSGTQTLAEKRSTTPPGQDQTPPSSGGPDAARPSPHDPARLVRAEAGPHTPM